MSKPKFSKQEHVQSVLGGAIMTVGDIVDGANDSIAYRCFWTEGEYTRSDLFPEDMLKHAPPPRRYGVRKIGTMG